MLGYTNISSCIWDGPVWVDWRGGSRETAKGDIQDNATGGYIPVNGKRGDK